MHCSTWTIHVHLCAPHIVACIFFFLNLYCCSCITTYRYCHFYYVLYSICAITACHCSRILGLFGHCSSSQAVTQDDTRKRELPTNDSLCFFTAEAKKFGNFDDSKVGSSPVACRWMLVAQDLKFLKEFLKIGNYI